MPESILKGAFLNGIRKDIEIEIKMLRLMDLEAVMLLAQHCEERNTTIERLKKNGRYLGQAWRYDGVGRPNVAFGLVDDPIIAGT